MRIADARRVRQRVESHAAQLRLRGARQLVLTAVLELTCGWKKVTDDRVRLHHIVALILDNTGRVYDLKTIGRALSSLAADHLIDYQPARGRGAHGVISIHPQFVGDVQTLQRNAAGKVIVEPESVTFSGRRYSPIGISKNLNTSEPQRPADEPPTTRPIAVSVNPNDISAVMAALPPVYDGLPRHLKWLLRVEVSKQLARGWLPGQILALLNAPLPEDVKKPYVLAMYRFKKNSIGPGPRLRRLQQAWDLAELHTQRRAANDTTARWAADVTQASNPSLREDLLAAFQTRYPAARLVHRGAMLAQAGRCALRAFPEMSLATALRSWVTQVLGDRGPTTQSTAPTVANLLMDAAHGDTCIACQATRGSIRPELPLPTPICDSCWTEHADPDLLEEIPA
ncbi:hypothetical protein A7R75_28875 [Mycolicibacterium llatzerense]|nr:hypothetical protein [Mycolicibacterium llatzerense]